MIASVRTERDRVEEPGKGPRRRSRSLRRPAALAAVPIVLLLVSTFVRQPYAIPSSSMAPTLQAGDRVLVSTTAYRFGGRPERGDVVVFDGRGSFLPEEAGGPSGPLGLLHGAGSALGLTDPPGTEYVKRVVGIGGDRVRCCDERGRLLVNGDPVTESYLHPGDAPSAVRFDVVVPEGRLWVMGDHRSASSDSRDHLGDPGGGTVPLERVTGRVESVAWPPDRWTLLPPGRSVAKTGTHG
ncbi:signal peptidase I [Streptomyces sp. TR02-1]|uniref:signal peptidase I n=1 Tax=Streptomyces sp. TR02-1 TaxID=3385977 RepID=UPI0039A18E12